MLSQVSLLVFQLKCKVRLLIIRIILSLWSTSSIKITASHVFMRPNYNRFQPLQQVVLSLNRVSLTLQVLLRIRLTQSLSIKSISRSSRHHIQALSISLIRNTFQDHAHQRLLTWLRWIISTDKERRAIIWETSQAISKELHRFSLKWTRKENLFSKMAQSVIGSLGWIAEAWIRTPLFGCKPTRRTLLELKELLLEVVIAWTSFLKSISMLT